MKKLLLLFVLISVLQSSAIAQTVYDDNYVENPNYLKGVEYMKNSQYSSAINEFKKAVRTNPNDDSALIGLSNAYNLRAKYYNDTQKDQLKAITDIKSALFFNKYFRQNNTEDAKMAVAQMEKNLSMLETSQNIKLTPSEILKTAKTERTKGEFAAAAYDYFRLLSDISRKVEANIAIGDIFKIFNRPDKSIYFYRQALAFESDNTDVHLKLARVYEDVKDYNASLKEYSYALEKSDEREDVLTSLERIWQKRIDETPNDAEAHANLGVVYQKQKRYNEAMDEYKKAESLNPSNVNTKINIATLYQEQKNYTSALNVYEAVLQVQPRNTNILLYRAQCLKELKRNEDSVSAYKDLLKIDPKNTQAKTELFALLKETMPVEDVLSFLYQNVINFPQDSNTYYEFAYELHNAGKIDDAITYYTQSIKMDNKNIDAYINLSQCYRQKKEYNNAYAVIKRASEIEPQNELVAKQLADVEKEFTGTIYNAATTAFQEGNYEKAIEIYSKIQPANQEALLGIAASYQALSDNEKSIEYYNKAMQLSPKNADIPYYIAAIYANSNNIEKAEEYTKLALSKNPNHAQSKELSTYIASKKTEGILEKAVKLYEDEKYNEAIADFNEILKITPDEANVYYYRALSYDALKEYKKAINDYQKVLKLSPQMNIAYYSIAVDYDSLGEYKSAKEFYTKYVNLIAEDNTYKEYAQARIKELP